MFQNIINITGDKLFYCAMCNNLRPSLTIIMNDGDQYFEKTSFLCPKIFIMPCV
jgi:hypothetical protein